MSLSIEFPGTAGNRYDYSINNNQDLAGGYTLLMVVRVLAANGSWQSFLESQTSGAVVRPCMVRHATGNALTQIDSTGARDIAAIPVTAAQSWQVVAITRPAGASQTVRGHQIIIGGATTRANHGSTASNDTAYATGKFIVAGDDDPANIRVAAWAIWDGTALTDGNIDGIASAKTTQSILDLTPTACFDSENGLMKTDLIGTLPGTLVGSITESSDGPSGWVYYGAGAPALQMLASREAASKFGPF